MAVPGGFVSPESDARGVSPVVGSLLLVALVVCLAAIVAIVLGTFSPGVLGPNAAFGMEVSADGRIELIHLAGESVDVEDLSITISVNGEPLLHQPDVPFNGNTGFNGAPSGAFHPESGPDWTAGDNASVKVAGTNRPEITTGDTVTVVLSIEGTVLSRIEGRAV